MLNAEHFNIGNSGCLTQPLFLTFYQDEDLTMADDIIETPVYVYKITCTVNGKAYIGITCRSVEHRFMEHVYDAQRKIQTAPTYISKAIRKHGKNKFNVECLYEAVSYTEAHSVERACISSHNTFVPYGYNLTTGGEKLAGAKVADEIRKKVGAFHKALWANPEYKAERVAKMYGRKVSEEGLVSLRAARQTPEYRKKASEAAKNRPPRPPVSEETRARISAATTGRVRSVEAIQKTAEKNKGKTRSAETRSVMSARKKEMWSDPEYKTRIIAAQKAGRLAAKRKKEDISL